MIALQARPNRSVSFECTRVLFPCSHLRTARLDFRGADGSRGFVWVYRAAKVTPPDFPVTPRPLNFRDVPASLPPVLAC